MDELKESLLNIERQAKLIQSIDTEKSKVLLEEKVKIAKNEIATSQREKILEMNKKIEADLAKAMHQLELDFEEEKKAVIDYFQKDVLVKNIFNKIVGEN